MHTGVKGEGGVHALNPAGNFLNNFVATYKNTIKVKYRIPPIGQKLPLPPWILNFCSSMIIPTKVYLKY